MLRSSALTLLLPTLFLAACVSDGEIVEQPRKDPLTEPWVTEWDGLAHDAIRSLDQAREGVADLPFTDRKLHTGRHMGVYMLALAPSQTLGPPFEERGEAIIVVEGEGSLEAAGQAHALIPGTVALLPGGTRTKVTATGRQPLLGLIVRANTKGELDEPTTQRPRVLPMSEYFSQEVEETPDDVRSFPIAALPGELSLHIVSVRGELDLHIHQDHDELAFILRGRGAFGVGSEGHTDADYKQNMLQRGFITYPVNRKAIMYIPYRAPHTFANAVDRTIALVIYGPDFRGQDTFKVKTYPKPKAETDESKDSEHKKD